MTNVNNSYDCLISVKNNRLKMKYKYHYTSVFSLFRCFPFKVDVFSKQTTTHDYRLLISD